MNKRNKNGLPQKENDSEERKKQLINTKNGRKVEKIVLTALSQMRKRPPKEF